MNEGHPTEEVSGELTDLMLTEHRHSLEKLDRRYERAADFIKWVIRTAVLVFAAFATVASIVQSGIVADVGMAPVLFFGVSVLCVFASFAYAVDSLSVNGPGVWLADVEEMSRQAASSARTELNERHRQQILDLNDEVGNLEESG